MPLNLYYFEIFSICGNFILVISFYKIILPLVVALFVLPSPAHAHLIGGYGISSGLTHPLFGLDHLLAMIAVGIISTQIGGKAIWQIPATFVLFMIVGGIFGISGLAVPFTEAGIAFSVLFLGAAIALPAK